MSYLKKKNRTFLWKWTVRLNKLACLGLIFFLLLLLSFLSLSFFYDEIHIPERVLVEVQKKLEEQGLRVTYDKIALDFMGNVTLDNATIYFIQSEEPVMNSERLYVNVNYAALTLGNIPISNIRLSDADLYCPAMLSPSGTTDHLIKDLDLGIQKDWGDWELYHFVAEIRDLKITAHGDLTTPIDTLMQQPAGEKRNYYLDYLKLCKEIIDYLEPLQYLDTPSLTLEFISEEEDQFSVSGKISTIKLMGGPLPESEQVKAEFNFQVLPQFKQLTPLSIWAESISLEEQEANARKVYLELETNTPITSIDALFPCIARATIGSVEAKGERLENITIQTNIQSMENAEAYFSSSQFGGTVSADLALNWKERTATGTINSTLDLTEVFAHPVLNKIWKLDQVFQNAPTYLSARFSTGGTLETTTADYYISTTDLDFIKTHFQRVLVQGSLNGTFLNAYKMESSGHGNSLKSSFTKDLTDPFYNFTTVGYMRPNDLNLWWKSWWTKMFGAVEFTDDLPWFDIAIHTAFIYKKQLSLHGFAEAKNFKLKGMPLDHMTTQLFVRPNYVDIYDLKIERPEGTATGEFQRELVQKKLKNVIVNVQSTIDLEESLNLFGEKGRKILTPYTWTGQPKLSLKGEFNFEDEERWQDLDIKIKTDSPMTFHDFPIDTLYVDARYDHGNVFLDNIFFEFAEGTGEAQVSMLRQNEESYLIFDLEIFDAELGETLKRLKEFQATEDEPSPDDSEAKAYEGKIHVKVSGFAPSGTGLKQIHAMGKADITEGNLVKIPLFGAVSELFPGSKLSLNNFSSRFIWDENTINFPNLIMRGDSARLEGAGNYYLSDSELNFQVKLFFLKESENALFSGILAPLLTPFSHIGTVNLKGTLKEPLWRFSFSPLNLLDSSSNHTDAGSETLAIPDYQFRK